MRMKLSVQFQGEEGIDAGGVSREWYQVSTSTLSSGVCLFRAQMLVVTMGTFKDICRKE